ncbi:MAG: hypothetical protein QM761_01450 [Pseudoxanthomonas sp.]
MIECNAYVQAIAAVSSAIAAITAVCVARSALAFQKNSLLKKASIELMLKIMWQLHYLKSLTYRAALGTPDQEFSGLGQRIADTKDDVMALESMLSATVGTDVKTIREFLCGLRESEVFAASDGVPNASIENRLDDAISAMNSIYRKEIK